MTPENMVLNKFYSLMEDCIKMCQEHLKQSQVLSLFLYKTLSDANLIISDSID